MKRKKQAVSHALERAHFLSVRTPNPQAQYSLICPQVVAGGDKEDDNDVLYALVGSSLIFSVSLGLSLDKNNLQGNRWLEIRDILILAFSSLG